MAKLFLACGSLLLALAVALGAFGAHIVQDMLTPERYEIYQTAVEYHFYHSIGLLIVGLTALHFTDAILLKWSGWSFFSGVVIFSGSLYLLTLTETAWLGAITPIGGIGFIAGWVFLAIAVFRSI